MEKRRLKILGAISILIGTFFVLNASSGITGFAIANSVGKNVSGILGLMLVVGGVILFMNKLEDKIRIYQDPNKQGDESYYLHDPIKLFSDTEVVDFLHFLEESKSIKDDPELLGYAKKHYGGQLIN